MKNIYFLTHFWKLPSSSGNNLNEAEKHKNTTTRILSVFHCTDSPCRVSVQHWAMADVQQGIKTNRKASCKCLEDHSVHFHARSMF